MRRLALLSCLVHAVAWAVDPIALAFPAPASLAVDGELVDWNPGRFSVSPPIDVVEGVGFVEQGAITSNADHSARLYVAYRPEALLFAARIRDDLITVARGEDLWKGDSFELLLGHADGTLLHVGVNAVGDVHAFSKHRIAGVRAAAQRAPGEWTVEVELPLGVLGLKRAGAPLRLNFGLRDVDEGAPAYRVWSGQRHGQLASAGSLRFEPSTPAPKWPSCASWTTQVKVTTPLRAEGRRLFSGAAPVKLRLLNFQPSRQNWQYFWTAFDLAQLRKDLDVAARLRANSLRLFVFYDEFGGDAVRPELLERLHTVVREASMRGLLSVVSFFPFKKELRPEWDARMSAHLAQLVASFQGDPAIAMWDLMNEPDHLLTQGATWTDLARWTGVMAAAVRRADPTHLVTLGLASPPPAEDPTTPLVDVVSVHWYGEGREALVSSFDRVSATGKPVIIQEFGGTSLYFGEAEVSAQLKDVCAASAKRDFAGVGVWELFDHPVGSILHVPDRWLETPEHDFGLIRADGRVKAQAGVFCRCLEVPRFLVPAP